MNREHFSVFDSSPKVILIFNKSLRLIYFNEKARQTFNLGKGGKTLKELFGSMEAKAQSLIETCFSGKGPIENERGFKVGPLYYKSSFNYAHVREEDLVVLNLEQVRDHKIINETETFKSIEAVLDTLGQLTSAPHASLNQKIQAGITAALDLFDLPLGIISRIQDENYTVLYSESRLDDFEIAPGARFKLSGTYCDVTWRNHSLVAVPKAGENDIYSNHPSYKNFKLETYIGIPLVVNSKAYGTLNLSSPNEYHENTFSDGKLEFFQLLAKWIENTIEVGEKERVSRLIQDQSETVQTLFEGVFNESPIAIAVGSVDRKLQIANKAFLNLYGLREEEIFGRCTSTLYADPEEYRRQASRFSRENKSKSSSMYTITYRRGDGSTFIGDTIGYPVHDKDGAVIGFIAQIIDKTEEIQKEEELQEQRLIAQQNSKLAAIGELAAGVGHEINNPLQIVNGYTELLRRKLLNANSEKIVARELDKIQCGIKRMVGIVEELRTFARVDECSELFNVKDAIDETMFLLKEIYQSEGIDLSFHLDEVDGSYLVEGYKGKFHQVIMNLLGNAKDATQGLEKREIKIFLKRSDNSIQISVKDNGVGISKEDSEKIFNPFFTTKAPGKGTGIGLSVSHKIIREHGGTVECVSKLNCGTEFIVSLPQNKKQAIIKNNEHESSTIQKLLCKNVIIVDDEAEIGQLLETFFEDEGVKVSLVESAEKAIEMVSRGHRFDAIITDMQMSGMNGLELLEQFKNSHPEVKRVLMTGGVDTDSAMLERMTSASELILYKPFFPEDAIEKIAHLYLK